MRMRQEDKRMQGGTNGREVNVLELRPFAGYTKALSANRINRHPLCIYVYTLYPRRSMISLLRIGHGFPFPLLFIHYLCTLFFLLQPSIWVAIRPIFAGIEKGDVRFSATRRPRMYAVASARGYSNNGGYWPQPGQAGKRRRGKSGKRKG